MTHHRSLIVVAAFAAAAQSLVRELSAREGSQEMVVLRAREDFSGQIICYSPPQSASRAYSAQPPRRLAHCHTMQIKQLRRSRPMVRQTFTHV